MKLTSDGPLANPDAAARKLLDIVRGSIAESTYASQRPLVAGCSKRALARIGKGGGLGFPFALRTPRHCLFAHCTELTSTLTWSCKCSDWRMNKYLAQNSALLEP
jgi:hypothetical protein